MESKNSNNNGKSTNYNNNNIDFSETTPSNSYPNTQMRQNNYNALNPKPNNNNNNYNKGYNDFQENNYNNNFDNNDQYKKKRLSIFRDGMTLKMSFKKVNKKYLKIFFIKDLLYNIIL